MPLAEGEIRAKSVSGGLNYWTVFSTRDLLKQCQSPTSVLNGVYHWLVSAYILLGKIGLQSLGGILDVKMACSFYARKWRLHFTEAFAVGGVASDFFACSEDS